MSIRGKKVLIGITGGIAAYKIALLIRLLAKEGAEVRVIATASALDFITPLTLSTLSNNPVLTDLFDRKNGQWHNHVDLGLWADVFVIAPLSANTLAKMAHGQSDNLLTTTYLSARCPVLVAPAMDLDMYRHPSVSDNLNTIRRHGVTVLDAATGELASGLSGQGRMREPEEIYEAIVSAVASQKHWEGKTVLITAGPTQEPIDPVRYISNHSSGKMGIALALEAARQGAKVYLVLGPTSERVAHPNIEVRPVVTADDMYREAAICHNLANVAIFNAAVADYGPANPATHKLKKQTDAMQILLKKNVDIAHTLGLKKRQGQIHVGFALETDNEMASAREKLIRKNFDLMVMNSLRDKGAGFKGDTNKVTFISADIPTHTTDVLPKSAIAQQILELTLNLLNKTK